MLIIVVFFSCVVLTSGGRSSHADYIEELIDTKAFAAVISEDIIEDATLDVSGLVQKYKYPFEEHFVITEDGYILRMHRIPHGRDSNNVPGNRTVVFAMHGLFSSSADFIVTRPEKAPAYILAEEGYDVWLGNARGNYFSRNHTRLNPDSLLNNDFWNFSWDEIGNKDLPAMIHYILKYTGKLALHYVGVSQGTTVFFVMTSLRPEYNEKIISMHALAPVAYVAYTKSPLLLAVAPFGKSIDTATSLLGIGELVPRSKLFTLSGLAFCSDVDNKIFRPACTSLFVTLGGYYDEQQNSTLLPVILGHAPAGSSVRQVIHYGQSVSSKDFRRYDFGETQNLLTYKSINPPKYNLSLVTAPVYIYQAEDDPVADVKDVDRLYEELGNPVAKVIVPQQIFGHFGFVWGIDLKTVYDKVIKTMKLLDLKT